MVFCCFVEEKHEAWGERGRRGWGRLPNKDAGGACLEFSTLDAWPRALVHAPTTYLFLSCLFFDKKIHIGFFTSVEITSRYPQTNSHCIPKKVFF